MNQVERVLILYCRLLRGEHINKANFSAEFRITERSFARDIRDIRYVLDEMHIPIELRFNKQTDAYYLSDIGRSYLNGMDALVFVKLLLGSRALRHDEMAHLIQVICSLLPKTDRGTMTRFAEDAMQGYAGPKHEKAVVKMQWDLTQCIAGRRRIRLQYRTYKGKTVYRDVFPVDVIVSQCYFYLIAFRVDETDYEYPAFFRLDRIHSFELLPPMPEDKSRVSLRFSDIAPSLPCMFGGNLIEATVWCSTFASEAVLDRLPNYQIVQYTDDGLIFKVHVFDEGFLRWLPTQGEEVKILSPPALQEALKIRLEAMLHMYSQKG